MVLLMQGETNKTPASARHKRGCNCKKSSCLKKYCECFQVCQFCSFCIECFLHQSDMVVFFCEYRLVLDVPPAVDVKVVKIILVGRMVSLYLVVFWSNINLNDWN